MDIVLATYWLLVIGAFCWILTALAWLADKLAAQLEERDRRRRAEREPTGRRIERR